MTPITRFLSASAAALLSTVACTTESASTDVIETAAKVEEPSAPAPALWKIADADTTIYLFGTVHILQPSLDWRTGAVDDALDESGTIYFETDLSPEAQAAVQGVVQQYALAKDGTKLSSYYNDAEKAKISAFADKVGFPMAGLEPFRPWFASLLLSIQDIVVRGGSPEAGVEMILFNATKDSGKEYRFFETGEEQIALLSSQSDTEAAEGLLDYIDFANENPNAFDELAAAWRRGDTDAVNDMLLEQLSDSPEILETLLYRRNANWVKELTRVMAEDQGTFFVAVGAGHLVGEKSVNDLMAQGGFTVDRVQ